MTDLRVGVVGMGVGQLHLLSWIDVRGASAVALVETDAALRAHAAADWGLDAYASLDELLGAGVDVVDLCTPPALHEAQIVQCLEAGVHVISEKPLVDSLAACDRLMLAVAGAPNGARLMPVLQYRFGIGAAQARALVTAGVTGRLFTASATTWWRRDADYYDEAAWRTTWQGALGGTVVNHAVHIHDLLTWIGGPLTEIHALVDTRVNDVATEDCAVAVGRTADGGLVTMNATTGAATESSRLAWCFEGVQIESATDPYHPAGKPWTFLWRNEAAERAGGAVIAAVPVLPDAFTGQFQAFVDGLASGTVPVTVDDARAALEVVTAWYHSARHGTTERLPIGADHPAYGSWLPEER
ncbi:MAG TPA: Gfo/Idh/MocA family oxidoreductase [Acidimicrobiales bacterium]|nr:Gfo/Idh/MocA family oxidoreductase [Acidimicrobiales bacterium]